MKKRFVLGCFLVGLAFSSCFSQSTVFIVRHAEKADDSKDPELSEAGRARAEALANMLRDSKISVIYTTQFKRTQQTAEPLAKALGLTVTTLLAENKAALVAKLRTSTATSLVVGHGNTMPRRRTNQPREAKPFMLHLVDGAYEVSHHRVKSFA